MVILLIAYDVETCWNKQRKLMIIINNSNNNNRHLPINGKEYWNKNCYKIWTPTKQRLDVGKKRKGKREIKWVMMLISFIYKYMIKEENNTYIHYTHTLLLL